MGVLTGPEIQRMVRDGSIVIEPFRPDHVGSNSVDLMLGDEIKVYIGKDGNPIDAGYQKALKLYPVTGDPVNERKLVEYLERNGLLLDIRKPPRVKTVTIPQEGYVLLPGRGYLAATVEFVGTDQFVPMLHGRSSVGRLFVSAHHTAGWGDTGFGGSWTLEITCVHPVRVYPGMRICQVSFESTVGDLMLYGDRDGSKYQGQQEPGESKIHEDFNKRG